MGLRSKFANGFYSCLSQLVQFSMFTSLTPRPMTMVFDLGTRLYEYAYEIIGASLSEPHTSVTALQDACVCQSAYVRTGGHIPKILIERMETYILSCTRANR